jgi:uncharacterized phage protein (TIGR02220 family)
MSGYIKLHRLFQKWEWRDDPNCVSVFIDLLHQANYVDGNYRGIAIPRGSLTTSQEKIGQRTGLSISQVRTVLDKLSLTGEIAVKITNKYSMISILKWEIYQGDDRQDSSPIALQSQSGRSRVATSKKLINQEGEKEQPTPSAKLAAGGAIVSPEFLVIDYFNSTLKKSFKQTNSNHNPIKARLKEGYTVEEMKTLIDHIAKTWVYDSFWQNQIKIPTIFSSKFDGYYQESTTQKLDPIEDFFAANNCAPMEN